MANYCRGDSGQVKVIESGCWGELATLTSRSMSNDVTPVQALHPVGVSSTGQQITDNIIVRARACLLPILRLGINHPLNQWSAVACRPQVWPFAMHFKQAQCFCQSVNNGHLASIHNEDDYKALEVAATKAGVTQAIFIGAHETAGA